MIIKSCARREVQGTDDWHAYYPIEENARGYIMRHQDIDDEQ